jgi:ParB-like chromosome segregation protein Spo0J
VTSIKYGPEVEIDVNKLEKGNSPRLGGESGSHVQALAQVIDLTPPILVHQSTMRVIDGMHRLRAAMLIGRPTVRAMLVDCSESEILVLAVQENARHGLPLSLRDREAAALRLLISETSWSDRMVARTVGLSPGMVARIRERSTAGSGQSNRVGMDGRVRPVDLTEGRRRAADFLADNPEASVREIAKAANISLSTAHDVRKRIAQNQDPIPLRPSKATPESTADGNKTSKASRTADAEDNSNPRSLPNRDKAYSTDVDWGELRNFIVKDPTIKYKQSGRELVKWLDRHWIELAEIDQHIDAVPAHLAHHIALVAERLAGEWKLIAGAFVKRADEFLPGHIESKIV